MTEGALGRVDAAGETIVRQGDVGDCMFVVLQGTVELCVPLSIHGEVKEIAMTRPVPGGLSGGRPS